MKLTGLWRHTEFRKLWAGQGISLIGHKVMFFATSAVLFRWMKVDEGPGSSGGGIREGLR